MDNKYFSPKDITLLEENIKDFLIKEGYAYSPIKKKENIPIIYELYISNVIPNIETISNDADFLRRIGIYYEIKKDYDNMIKFYTMSYEKGDGQSACNLALYYEYLPDVTNMLKTYLIGIQLGHSESAVNIAKYYSKNKDYDNEIKYYEIALSLGDSSIFTKLGIAYYNRKLKIGDGGERYNLDRMKQCWKLALENNNEDIIYVINRYLEIWPDVEYAQLHWSILNEKNNDNYSKNFGVVPICEI